MESIPGLLKSFKIPPLTCLCPVVSWVRQWKYFKGIEKLPEIMATVISPIRDQLKWANPSTKAEHKTVRIIFYLLLRSLKGKIFVFKTLAFYALTKLTFEKINFLRVNLVNFREKLTFDASSMLIFNLTFPRSVKTTYRELHRWGWWLPQRPRWSVHLELE